MLTLTTLALFAAATLGLLAVPGPSVVYVVARTVEHGRRAGLISMVGLELGALVHVVLAAVGVTAIFASSDWAFTVVRYLGAAYLIVMGIRQLRRRQQPGSAPDHSTTASPWRLFRDGVLVDLLNPKTALFFLAFLPQFVDPARGPVTEQTLVLGGCFVVLAAAVDSSYVVATAALQRRIRKPRHRAGVIPRLTAVVYLGLGGLAIVV